MAEPNYKVDYNDERLTSVETEKSAALTDLKNTYADMQTNTDKYYDTAIKGVDDYKKQQTDLQNQQTDIAINEIEENKKRTEQDYQKEQKGAYVDYQKQIDPYGGNAEKMASMGMSGTGYSESSQVSMYNTYQNRVAVARESFNRAIVDYDNAITEARVQNSVALAEIAYNALKDRTELLLAQTQYKNQLLADLTNQKLALEQNYWQRYQDIVSQINTENSLAEQVRQHNEEMAYKNASLAEEQRQFNILHPQNGGSIKGGNSSVGGSESAKGKKQTQIENKDKENSAKVSKDKQKAASEQKMMKSIIDLGYGPISANKLNDLVASGKVIEEEKDGNYTFKNAKPTGKLNASKYLKW